jgi:hypothetical protein
MMRFSTPDRLVPLIEVLNEMKSRSDDLQSSPKESENPRWDNALAMPR